MLIRLLAFSLLGVLSSGGDGPKRRTVSVHEVVTPARLLHQADLESKPFPPEERAGVLQALSRASLSIDKTKTLLWSKELIRTAHELPLGQDRAAYQKNALVAIARVNPQLAASLYRQQDNLRDWATDEIPSEDIRADGTRTLFPALWRAQGVKSLPEIRSIATWLGDTGGYPYSGLTPIFGEIAAQDKNAATQLFLDAVAYLPKGQDIRSTNRIFTDFFLASWKLVPAPLVKQALASAVDAFNASSQDDRMPKFRAESAGRPGMAFSSQAEVFLYKLLPVARELDPDLAHKIEEQHQRIAEYPAAQKDARIAGVISFPGSTPDAERRALDESRYYQAGQLAESDPVKAVAIAQEIADPDIRQAALVEIAPFSKTDSSQSGAWIENAAKHLDDMNASVAKLRVMTALANAYFVRGDQAQALTMTSHAMDLGEELYAQYMLANPGAMSYSADGVDELTDLTRKAVARAKDPQTVVSRVEQLREDVLKANLLPVAAESWSERPAKQR